MPDFTDTDTYTGVDAYLRCTLCGHRRGIDDIQHWSKTGWPTCHGQMMQLVTVPGGMVADHHFTPQNPDEWICAYPDCGRADWAHSLATTNDAACPTDQ